uniref:Uncharacterized protein n=1 Tax=Oncorhynchus tshawytscha TaxID=74940 RepID=A0A8C8C1T4_ONCTS
MNPNLLAVKTVTGQHEDRQKCIKRSNLFVYFNLNFESFITCITLLIITSLSWENDFGNKEIIIIDWPESQEY